MRGVLEARQDISEEFLNGDSSALYDGTAQLEDGNYYVFDSENADEPHRGVVCRTTEKALSGREWGTEGPREGP